MPSGDGTGPMWAQGRGFGRGCRAGAGTGWRARSFGRCVLDLSPEERKAMLEQEKKEIEAELSALEAKQPSE